MAPVAAATRELQVDDVVRSEASALVEEAHDRQVAQLVVTLEDGQSLPLSPALTRLVANLLEGLASGAVISASSMPEELTTTVAAKVLGVSRPTLMKLVERGEVAAHKVGAHTRLRRADVLALRAHRARVREAAMQELLAAGEAFD